MDTGGGSGEAPVSCTKWTTRGASKGFDAQKNNQAKQNDRVWGKGIQEREWKIGCFCTGDANTFSGIAEGGIRYNDVIGDSL